MDQQFVFTIEQMIKLITGLSNQLICNEFEMQDACLTSRLKRKVFEINDA